MIVTASSASRVTNAKSLSTTGLVSLVNAGKLVKTLESLSAACKDTDTSFTLVFNDGTTDYVIIPAKVISAHETFLLDSHHILLRPGQSLKVMASAANQISVVAVTLDAPPVQASGNGGQ